MTNFDSEREGQGEGGGSDSGEGALTKTESTYLCSD